MSLSPQFLDELRLRTSLSALIGRSLKLQKAGMIKYARGKIQILNVDALHETACECYTTVKAHYESLMGDAAK